MYTCIYICEGYYHSYRVVDGSSKGMYMYKMNNKHPALCGTTSTMNRPTDHSCLS